MFRLASLSRLAGLTGYLPNCPSIAFTLLPIGPLRAFGVFSKPLAHEGLRVDYIVFARRFSVEKRRTQLKEDVVELLVSSMMMWIERASARYVRYAPPPLAAVAVLVTGAFERRKSGTTRGVKSQGVM